MTFLIYGQRSLDRRSRNWFGCCWTPTPFELLVCARWSLVFVLRFSMTQHWFLTSIFAEFWTPFQMFSVSSIAVFPSHLETCIYRAESMWIRLGSTCCIAAIGRHLAGLTHVGLSTRAVKPFPCLLFYAALFPALFTLIRPGSGSSLR